MNIESRKIHRGCLAAALMLCLSGAGQAATEIGITAAVNADAKSRITDLPPRTVTLGQNVIFNEQITTDGTGLVQILLLDGTTFTIGPNSDVRIDEYVYDPDAGQARVIAAITKGTFRFIGGQTSRQPDGATIRTPSGSIGIRGAIIQGRVADRHAIFSMVSGKEMTFTGAGGTRRLIKPGYTLEVTDGEVEVHQRTDVDASTFFSDLAGDPDQGGGTAHQPDVLDAVLPMVARVNSQSDAAVDPIAEDTLAQIIQPAAISEPAPTLDDATAQAIRDQIVKAAAAGRNAVRLFGLPGGPPIVVPIVKEGDYFLVTVYDTVFRIRDVRGAAGDSGVAVIPIETALSHGNPHGLVGTGLNIGTGPDRVTGSIPLATPFGRGSTFAPLSSAIDRDFTERTARLAQDLYVTAVRKADPDNLVITYRMNNQSHTVTLNRTSDCTPDSRGFIDCAKDGHFFWSWTSRTGSPLDAGGDFEYLEAHNFVVGDDSDRITYIFGVNPEALPRGSALYTGNFVAESFSTANPDISQRQRYRGRLVLTANFDLRTLDGYVYEIRGSIPGDSPLSGDLVEFPGTTWFSIRYGRIRDGQFTAVLIGRDENPDAPYEESVRDFVGRLVGRFFGPNAEEIGAVVSATRDVEGEENDRVLAGYVAGRRQEAGPQETFVFDSDRYGLSISDSSNTQTDGSNLATLMANPTNVFAPFSVAIDRDTGASTAELSSDFRVTSIRKSGPDDLAITYTADGTSNTVTFNRDTDCFETPEGSGFFDCEDAAQEHYLWSWTSASAFDPGEEFEYLEAQSLLVGSDRITYIFGAVPAALPTGRAAYTGYFRADAYRSTDPDNALRQRLYGRMLLSANFDLRTLTGLIDHIRGTQPGEGSGNRVYWHTSSFVVTNGRIADGQFTALLTGRDSDPDTPLNESVRGFVGQIAGWFFGPNAEEVGAVVSAIREGFDDEFNQVLYGFFGGRKQQGDRLDGVAVVGQNDFVVYFLNYNHHPRQLVYMLAGTQYEPAWFNPGTGGTLLTYSLVQDPVQGIDAPFFHPFLYGPLDNLAKTDLHVIANTHSDRASSFLTWLDISGSGADQKSAILVAPGSVLQREGKAYMLNMRGGSFRSEAAGPLAIMRGESSTVPGSSDQHFFGPGAENFVLGPDTPESFHDDVSQDCVVHACNNGVFSYEDRRRFNAYHVANQVDQVPLPARRTSRTVSGFMTGMAEQSGGGYSTPYILAAGNSQPNFQITLNASENTVSAFADVEDVEGDSTTIAALELSVGPRNGLTGASTFVDDDVYGATHTVGGTTMVTDNDQDVVVTESESGTYLVSGRAAPLPGYQHCTACTFADWGWWGTKVTATVDSSGTARTQSEYVHLGTWVAGDITNPGDLPTGPTSATFLGTALANIANDGSQYIASGDFSMTMDLSTRTGDLNISNLDGATYTASVSDASTATQSLFTGSLSGDNGYSGAATGALVNDGQAVAAGAIGQFHASSGANRVVGTFMGAR